jgi:1-deoxy-D-xylulose-5-phosphate reductoisomerase
MVEFIDGSVLAQLGSADMRIPIAYALGWPDRIPSGADRLDLLKVRQLDFEEPDLERFPALKLARQAMEEGGSAPAVLNAANEVAVAAFLGGRIGFSDIARLVEDALQGDRPLAPTSIDDVIAIDQGIRRDVEALVREGCH